MSRLTLVVAMIGGCASQPRTPARSSPLIFVHLATGTVTSDDGYMEGPSRSMIPTSVPTPTPTSTPIPTTVSCQAPCTCLSSFPVPVLVENQTTNAVDLCTVFERATLTTRAFPTGYSMHVKLGKVVVDSSRSVISCKVSIEVWAGTTGPFYIAGGAVVAFTNASNQAGALEDCVEATVGDLIARKVVPFAQGQPASSPMQSFPPAALTPRPQSWPASPRRRP